MQACIVTLPSAACDGVGEVLGRAGRGGYPPLWTCLITTLVLGGTFFFLNLTLGAMHGLLCKDLLNIYC